MKLCANTIIETIISLILITFSFMLVIIFVNSITKENNWNLKLKAIQKVKDISSDCKLKQNYINDKFKSPTFEVEKIVSVYNNNKHLLHIKLIAKDSAGLILYQSNEIFLSPY